MIFFSVEELFDLGMQIQTRSFTHALLGCSRVVMILLFDVEHPRLLISNFCRVFFFEREREGHEEIEKLNVFPFRLHTSTKSRHACTIVKNSKISSDMGDC